ncbi:MAG: YihY/virulence factor BrkB family protein [Actinomycetota bacterium]
MANPAERVVQRLDDLQQRFPPLALPVGVVRKFADDRTSAWGALMTFYGFLALFPLVVITLTVIGHLAAADPELEEALLQGAVGQIPIVGTMIEEDVSGLQAGGLGFAVGLLGLFWGATGIYNSGQLAMSQIWNVEGIDRPGLPVRLARSMVLFVLFATGAIGGGWLVQQGFFSDAGSAIRALTFVGSLMLGFAMFSAIFRILTPHTIPMRKLWLGAALATVGWEALQIVGGIVVSQETDQVDVYGVFAYTIALLMWLWLAFRVMLFSAEAAVVIDRGLWPRNIAQPPLNDADKRVLASLARNERRRPEQHIEVWFDDSEEDEEEGLPVDRYEDRSGDQTRH